MDLRIGQITGYEIKKNRDGGENVLLLQVQDTGPDDIQTVEFYQAAGQDSNPPTNSLVAFLAAGNAWKIALGSNDGIVPSSIPGEYKIYSSLNGVIKAFLKLFTNGLARLSSVTIEFLASSTALFSAASIDIISTGLTKLSSATLDLLASAKARLIAAVIDIIATGVVTINGSEVIINGIASMGNTDMELGGNTDNAVRFSSLETAFNQLKSDFDSHTGHGIGGTPSTSTADISGAKIDNIKTS